MTAETDRHTLRLRGNLNGQEFVLLRALVSERIGELGRARIDFASSKRSVDIKELLGNDMTIESDGGSDPRTFLGTCVAIEHLGHDGGYSHYAAELRPWLWYLTRWRDNRVFQDMSTPDIVQKVLSEHEMSGDLEKSLSATYPARTICVQYGETDLAFVSRLMEEEGIAYAFHVRGGRLKMVVSDSQAGFTPIDGEAKLPFHNVSTGGQHPPRYVSDWLATHVQTSHKIELADYDFERPGANGFVKSDAPDGKHGRTGTRLYDTPGRFRKEDDGKTFARVRMEAEAVRQRSFTGRSNAAALSAGRTFTLSNRDRKDENDDYLVTDCEHRMRLDEDIAGAIQPSGGFGGLIDVAGWSADRHHVDIVAIPKGQTFRPAQTTPWPSIPGVQTAVVTGPSGEEIHTDKYGRVRVQFHWDQQGEKDDKSTCWVRVAMPWTGKNWGMMAIPRIGQEVVVQFEEGNPDRPLVTGMLYNADTMPPWKLPENKTQSGVKSNSSIKGSGYNELMFEDKKGAELIRFHAERDFSQVVENDATITVGLEDKDKGDLDLTVHRHLTETIKTGDWTVDTSLGSIAITAKKEIKMTVGKSSITIDPMGVTIKAPTITAKAEMKLSASAPMSEVKGNATLILKGGMVMIN